MRIRRAEPADADFIAGLVENEEVAPFLSAVRARGREATLERIERSLRGPAEFGVFVIEVDGQLAGLMEFEEGNRRSRIANLGGLAIHPDFRGRRLADDAAREFQRHLLLDLGYHRLQMEVYEFNERAIAHADRAGWVREGERRKAYRRHGQWTGSALYSLLREDLGLPPGTDLLYEYVARHNLAVRHGDWEAVGELFADEAVPELPSDEEVRIVEVLDNGDTVVAAYASATATGTPAGSMKLQLADEHITALAVTV